MKIVRFPCWLMVLAALGACSTDFEVNAPYQEVKAIYCVLDGADSVQYARVGKGFQNEDRDARDIAQNEPDSSNFRSDDVTVKLFEVRRPGGARDTVFIGDFQPVTINTKDSGVFAHPEQLVFRLPYRLNPNALGYKLEVNSRRSGISSRGFTNMVESLSFFRPAETSDSVVFGLPNQAPDQKVVLGSVGDITNPRTVVSLKVNLRAKVIENFINPVNGQMSRTVDILWGNVASNFNEQGVQQYQYEMRLLDFVNTMRSQLNANDPNVVSRILLNRIEYEAVSSSKELPTYLDVVNNFSAITQSAPVYSNMSNSLGILGCINRRFTTKRLQRVNRVDIRTLAPELKFIVP